MHMPMSPYIHTYVNMVHIHTNSWIHVYIYIYIYIHTYIHVHIYTYKQGLPQPDENANWRMVSMYALNKVDDTYGLAVRLEKAFQQMGVLGR